MSSHPHGGRVRAVGGSGVTSIGQVRDLLGDQSNQKYNYRCTQQQHAHVREATSFVEGPAIPPQAGSSKRHCNRCEQLERRVQGGDLEYDQEEADRSEEHTSELQSLMRISSAVFCLIKKTYKTHDPSQKYTD